MGTFAALTARPGLRQHALLSVLFLLGRWLLDLAGLRISFSLDWMFLADPGDLRDHLLHTAYYAHSFPPGMNLLAGWLLKLGPAAAINGAHALYQVFGLVMVNALFFLLRGLGLGAVAALVLATAFSLLPQTIYFEHLFLYTYPTAALLALAGALFLAAARRPTFWTWSACFVTCAAIGWIRSVFHLAWLVAMVALALPFVPAGQRRQPLLAAIAPTAWLLALYLKNLLVFGVFGALTFGPANVTTATIRNLPRQVRDEWVKQGKLSPFAAISVYEGPRAYLPLLGHSENPRWPPMMNALERPSIGLPNFNHWFFLQVNPRRRDDARVYLRQRPGEYLRTVAVNVKEYFQPSTHWHPHDAQDDSPHRRHRQVLGGYERAFDRVVHGLPLAPVGLYLFTPLPLVWAAFRLRRLWRSSSPDDRARAALIAFALFQILYVSTLSVLLAQGEAERYRFKIEAFLWLLSAAAAVDIVRYLRARRNTPTGKLS
jgi:hypothetical protein